MDRNSEPMAAGDRRRVPAGLALNAAAGLWWADPLAALVIVFYALREARVIFFPLRAGGLNRHEPHEMAGPSVVAPR